MIGTPGTASGSFASTNGWAPVLQEDSGATVRVVPEDIEPMRYRRLTDREDIAISSVSAAEMRFQTQGIGGYASTKPVPQRVMWHHNDTPWGYVVAGDSELQSIEDIKKGGVRVAEGMFSPPMQAAVRKALPAFVGMSPEELAQCLNPHSKRPGSDGDGLGLAIVQELAASRGYAFAIRSTVGGGTRAEIRLPRADRARVKQSA